MGKRHIIITGAAGLIGQIVIPFLVKEYDVIATDLCSNNSSIKTVDISDYEQINNIISINRPVDCVIHLAANSNYHATWSEVIEPNIIGLLNVYKAAQGNGVRRVIYASSNHVTGGLEKHQEKDKVINASMYSEPLTPYAVTKTFGELVAYQFYSMHRLSSVCIRIGSVREIDNPLVYDKNQERLKNTWLTHNDLINMLLAAITAEVDFGIYYGVSDNQNRFWDISNTIRDLNFIPTKTEW